MAEATETPTSLHLSVESGRVEHKLRMWPEFNISRWLGREEQPSPSSHKTKEHPVLPRPGFGRRLSRKVVPGLWCPSTFRRQTSEQRERLEPVKLNPVERRTAFVGRRKALNTPPDSPSEPTSLDFEDIESPRSATSSGGNEDDEIKDELEKKWIFNLTKNFELSMGFLNDNRCDTKSVSLVPPDSKTGIIGSKVSETRTSATPIARPRPHHASRRDDHPLISNLRYVAMYSGHDMEGQISRVQWYLECLALGTCLDNNIQRTTDPRFITLPFHNIKSTKWKWKRGLSGFVNGRQTSALPDTGSLRNVVSQAFAQEMNLSIEQSPSNFMVGNTKLVKSIGTVCLDWAFSESPRNLMKIVCDVIPNCSYPIILGSSFLAATQTLSKYRRRLTECLFSTSMSNVLQMNYLGDDCQRLFGHIGAETEAFAVAAVPDTGAEGNILDYRSVDSANVRGPAHRNILQFADGTYQETVGQVETYWTFGSGERIPVAFEVLENCCADVILGESILYNHNVFEDHTSSFVVIESDSDAYQLAPFDFANRWQRSWPSIKECFKTEKDSGQASSTASGSRIETLRQQETRRQEDWDYQYSFGETASDAEKAAEDQRRANFRILLQNPPPAPPGSRAQQTSPYQVPSIPTAPNHDVYY
ncbi:MAG: hypothetical protein Q9207_008229 [Kuettlingeria erythrocarpa]